MSYGINKFMHHTVELRPYLHNWCFLLASFDSISSIASLAVLLYHLRTLLKLDAIGCKGVPM